MTELGDEIGGLLGAGLIAGFGFKMIDMIGNTKHKRNQPKCGWCRR